MKAVSLSLALAAGAALALPSAAAGALAPPSALGVARDGALTVVAGVDVGRRDVTFAGGWLNTDLACDANRRLRLTGRVFRTPLAGNGPARTFAVRRSGIRANCAEGGPNLPLAPSAAAHDMACADGTWRRGRYGFVARTEHVASGLVALVDVSFVVRRRCPA